MVLKVFVFIVTKKDTMMMMTKSKGRKENWIYICIWNVRFSGQRMFFIGTVLIRCCYNTKTRLKTTYNSQSFYSNWTWGCFVKVGWYIYKMVLTIPKPKQGKVSDFERFQESRFTQILYWQRHFVDFCFILCVSTAVLLTVRPTWSLGTVKKSKWCGKANRMLL